MIRVGVYVDAFDVYYGGRALCGRAGLTTSLDKLPRGCRWSRSSGRRVGWSCATKKVDAAVVFSNDSDLAIPLERARLRVPLGTVSRRKNPRR